MLKQNLSKGALQIMNIKSLNFPKIGFFVLYILFLITTLSFVRPDPAAAGANVRDSMVKIYCVQNEPDYDNPWNMIGPETFSGSGCVIAGNRILTNAHVVSNRTYIMVRLHGQSQKHPAKLIAVSHEADLALLTVEDASFFADIKPLKFGELPEFEQEVVVCGFPEGGDTLSTTKGVISRIEHQRYAHSWIRLLAGQLDAAINPGNSGGPVMVGRRIVGVVMQSRKKSENIGYMVPVPVIEHFLTDMEDGHYDGFPEDGMVIQPLENAGLKKMFGLSEEQSGALVTSVTAGSPAENRIFPGDVLLSIDGHRIADDCTVEFRPRERTSCDFYVKQHQVGEDAVYQILRHGKEQTVRLTLNRSWGNNTLVPTARYDVQPTYYVYGGLVFCPLTLNYLLTWGDDWPQDAPYNLLSYFVDGELTREGEEVVVVIKVLANDVNNGYDDLVDTRVVEVNGKKIRNLQDLIRTVETDTENPYVVFETEHHQIIAIDRKKAEAAHDEILSIYRIADDRSSDLKDAVSSDKSNGKEMARSDSPEANALKQ
jgi:S1-C subfamily serine protease